MLHCKDIEAAYKSPWLPSGEKPVTRSFRREGGAIEIGKINLILIGLIVVILFTLIAKEEPTAAFSHAAPRLQSQIVQAEAPEVDIEAPGALQESNVPEVETTALPKVTSKTSDKQPKKVEVSPVLASGPVVSVRTSPASTGQDKAGHANTSSESVSPENASTNMLVFNIWSVSELRLRSAYTTFMNDSALSPSQIEARKKDYLNFVLQRSRKCGELDNKFASNINTAEKLSFNKREVDILECHATENNIELDKINAHG